MNPVRIRSSIIKSLFVGMPLAVAITTSMGVSADTIEDLNLSVAKSHAILSSMNKKAKKALVNAAQDETFKEYFSTHDDDHKHELKGKIDDISLNVQDNFHVEEMCLIDPNGSEISRIVGSKIAHDLSNEEASADFFAPSFAQKPRTVYQAPIYMSPDVDKWVVAYVTPVVAQDETKAILHYEHGLDVYHRLLDKTPGPANSIKLAITIEGLIIWDHENPINVHKVNDIEVSSAYFETFEFGGKNIDQIIRAIDKGRLIIGDDGEAYQAAYRLANDWYILALGKSQSKILSASED